MYFPPFEEVASFCLVQFSKVNNLIHRNAQVVHDLLSITSDAVSNFFESSLSQKISKKS